MGKEVTAVHVENKAPDMIMENDSAQSPQQVRAKSNEGNNELKDLQVNECSSEGPQGEYSSSEVKYTKTGDQKSNTSVKPEPEAAADRPQEPSDTTVDEQVYDCQAEVEVPVSPTPSNSKSTSSVKKSESSTSNVARKCLEDDDSWSLDSSGASMKTMKSRTTVGVAPSFTCKERLEKRKEYYAKLEEKRKALEAEKREYEARTKEEEQAAIKQLRKNMIYRANPVPNFYYEKPPPKKELKKFPTTRAVSPKLGRRKSCGDMVNASSEETGCARAWRHSLGGREGLLTPKQKKHQLASSNVKDRSKQGKESTKNSPPKIEQTNADIAVQS